MQSFLYIEIIPNGDYLFENCEGVKKYASGIFLARQNKNPAFLFAPVRDGVRKMAPTVIRWMPYIHHVGAFFLISSRTGVHDERP